ncbi:5-formyltetrahydrofolate cyclo-ligase [Vibrio maerlii]|uniref:5-formyltetrahydrofolate cyclo-ligase n=1 Tax=Vibrio maerlii TaxID=2231648 RepID=UPI000E3DB5F4|nr:5-formyltetrahydrofolate cyclo-ligase [Vibrio maerlii]
MQTSTRNEIRQQIRLRRNSLTSEKHYQAAVDLRERCLSAEIFRQSQHIALYVSADGEIDTQPLIEALWKQGKQVYVPVLHPFSKGHLLFLRYAEDSPLTFNKYNIVEPKLDQTQIIPVYQLDLICTPLVAFDESGQRLGMGGGYYDRTLEKWFTSGEGAQPVGLAHDCQKVEALPCEEWDIPLPIILTPSKTWSWSNEC